MQLEDVWEINVPSSQCGKGSLARQWQVAGGRWRRIDPFPFANSPPARLRPRRDGLFLHRQVPALGPTASRANLLVSRIDGLRYGIESVSWYRLAADIRNAVGSVFNFL